MKKSIVLLLVCAVGWAVQTDFGKKPLPDLGNIGSLFRPGASEGRMKEAAASVKPGEIVMYATAWCPYCAQMRSWFGQYGFPYVECNVEMSAACEREWLSLGGKGVPLVVVRGQVMSDGFEESEFLSALEAS